jgi:2',3'-cyclic-nucleotide 3'-phosphodiesterase
MPGSSLWLVPPPSHPLHGILNKLVSTTLPDRFPRESASSPAVAPHFFAAHMTLTSEIDPARYGSDAQAWLDSIPWPSSSPSSSGGNGGGGVRVRFERVDTQDVFFRRCFIRVGFDGVREVAGLAREYGVVKGGNEGEEGTKKLLFSKETEEWLDWWRAEYGPHVSLI